MALIASVGRTLETVAENPDTFEFFGTVFEVPSAVGAASVLRFAWESKQTETQMDRAQRRRDRALTDSERDAATSDMGAAEMAGMAAMYGFLQAMLGDQWAQFIAVADEARADEDELMEIVQALIGAVAGRPTKRPSGSSGGPSSTGGSSTDAPAWGASPPPLTPAQQARAEMAARMAPVGAALSQA